MKNKEKYFNEIMDIIINGGALALLKDDKIIHCSDMEGCEDCQFFNSDGCTTARKEWLEAEYSEFKKGELVEVSDDEQCWNLRFFDSMSDNNSHYRCGRYKDDNNTNYCWKYCRKYGTLGGGIDII